LRLVQSQEYVSPRCWFNDREELVVYVVMAEDGSLGVPYITSVSCLAEGEYDTDGESVLDNIARIRLADDHGQLQRLFPRLQIASSLASHRPLPSSTSKVYFARFRAERANDPYIQIYSARAVLELKDTGLLFEDFLRLDRATRSSLINRYR
jgi:hypothetical protein